MGRKTNKDFQEERRKLFHVRKVSKPDDLLDKQLVKLCEELNINLRNNRMKGNDNNGNKK